MRLVWSSLNLYEIGMKARVKTYPVETKYSPPGLQARPLTGPPWPEMAPISIQDSSEDLVDGPWSLLHRHRLQPPDQPQATASFPSSAQTPPTKPPSLCPPISPNRCLFIHMEVFPSSVDTMTVDGDHIISEESVDVDKRVGNDEGVVLGRQEREVTPAS